MLFQEPSLFLVHFLIKRKMKEIGGGLANLERKLQQQMINHRHILIVWKMIWMFRMDYWGPLFSTIINIRITQKLMMIHWLRTKTSELRCKFQCNREGAFFVRAQTMCVIDDFGNVIEQHLKLMRLVPTVDYTNDACFFYPLFIRRYKIN